MKRLENKKGISLAVLAIIIVILLIVAVVAFKLANNGSKEIEELSYTESENSITKQKSTVSENSARKNAVSESKDSIKDEKISSNAEFGTVNNKYKNDFGKKVSGYDSKKGKNWRLFYADSESAYLICDRIDDKEYGLTNTSVVKGYGTSKISPLAEKLNPKFTSNGDWTLKSHGSNLNMGIEATAALLDKDQWTDYSTDSSNESIANWAVGAPTLEIFIASYNATHTTQLSCTVENKKSEGYKISKDGGAYNTSISGLGYSKTDKDGGIYCNGTYGWWLASPVADYGSFILYVGDTGYLEYTDCAAGSGIRPLVSVPLSKIGTGEGKIVIEEY